VFALDEDEEGSGLVQQDIESRLLLLRSPRVDSVALMERVETRFAGTTVTSAQWLTSKTNVSFIERLRQPNNLCWLLNNGLAPLGGTWLELKERQQLPKSAEASATTQRHKEAYKVLKVRIMRAEAGPEQFVDQMLVIPVRRIGLAGLPTATVVSVLYDVSRLLVGNTYLRIRGPGVQLAWEHSKLVPISIRGRRGEKEAFEPRQIPD